MQELSAQSDELRQANEALKQRANEGGASGGNCVGCAELRRSAASALAAAEEAEQELADLRAEVVGAGRRAVEAACEAEEAREALMHAEELKAHLEASCDALREQVDSVSRRQVEAEDGRTEALASIADLRDQVEHCPRAIGTPGCMAHLYAMACGHATEARTEPPAIGLESRWRAF